MSTSKKIAVPLVVLSLLSLALVRQSSTTGFVQSGKFSIHYKVSGKGTPLLLLQGGPGFSSEIIKEMADLYDDHYQIITFDPRGVGKSKPQTWSLQDISIEMMVDDIEAVRKAVGCERWMVYGNCWGGTYAAAYAAKFPERIKSLVLSASAGIDLVDYSHVLVDDVLSVGNKAKLETIRTENSIVPSSSVSKFRYNRDDNEEILKLFGKYSSTKSVYDAALAHRVFNVLFEKDFDLNLALSKVEIPTLVVHGRHDYVPLETALKTAKIFSSEVVIFEKSAHMLEKDEPEKFKEIFIKFLTDNNE